MADRSFASSACAGWADFSSAIRPTGMLEGDVRSAAGRGTKEKPVIAPPAPRLTSAVACCHQGRPADGMGSPRSLTGDGALGAGRFRTRGPITALAVLRAHA